MTEESAEKIERNKYAIDLAVKFVQQIIALSTGVIALSFTFVINFTASISGIYLYISIAIWFFLLIAIIAGLMVFQNLLFDAGRRGPIFADVSITDKRIQRPVLVQAVSFFIAIVLLIFELILLPANTQNSSDQLSAQGQAEATVTALMQQKSVELTVTELLSTKTSVTSTYTPTPVSTSTQFTNTPIPTTQQPADTP